ncbi:MAG: hypothetical protein KBF78_14180 [Fuscovulum sp.]|nr:hypothetical protein [Fuscovulum sp.]
MCNAGRPDPRDAVGVAERALWGLRILIHELPPDADIPASGIGPILDLIHDRLDPAVDALQSYVPRDTAAPAA